MSPTVGERSRPVAAPGRAAMGAVALLATALAAASAGPASPPAAPSPDGRWVKVHRAYRYAGPGYPAPAPGMQDVAVDIEVGPSVDIDPDDVEIIDAETDEKLDAGPETAYLRPDGTLLSWRHPPARGPVRMLLIFEVPGRLKKLVLEHWGERLTAGAVTVAPSGPALPREEPATRE